MIKPKLIHPIDIEIVLRDENGTETISDLGENTNSISYYNDNSLILTAKKGSKSGKYTNFQQSSYNRGGEVPRGDGYFLLYREEIEEKVNDLLDDFSLEILKKAKIIKESDFDCNYDIIDVVPCCSYNGKFHFILLEYKLINYVFEK